MPRPVLRRRGALLALSGIISLSAALVAAQAPAAPKASANDELIAKIVAMLLQRGHLSKPAINDEIAQKWARNYVKALDPLKYNFVKSDVEEFLKKGDSLDDALNLDDPRKAADLTWAQSVFDRFVERSDERYTDAKAILAEKVDFDAEESIVDDPERIDFPKDGAEAKDRLRKQIKLELLRSKLGGEELDKATKRLLVRYKDRNRFIHQFDTSEILEYYLSALAMAVDPHSSYMNHKSFEDMMGQQLHLTLDGIGASLQVEDGFPTVMDVVSGGAADKDGRLQVGDRIVGVENADGQREDFVEKKLNDVVRKIRGPRGTKVKIIVQPAESKEQKVYELTRQKIELTEARAKSQILEAKDEKGKPIKIGVIHLPAFYGDTAQNVDEDPNAASATRDCRRLLKEFKEQGVKAVIMDLRMNGGGLLNEAISLSGLFIDTGPVVQVREASGVSHLDDDDEGTTWDGPLAVVIDHFSASASEIFAGVIKDYGRGLIVGDSSTFGKGTVQKLIEVDRFLHRPDGKPSKAGALKLTIQQFYRPNGDSTQIRGVEPDVHIPSTTDLLDFTEGKSENALKFDRVAPLPHLSYNLVPADLVAVVKEHSETRRKASPKFQEDAAFLKRVEDRKKRHEISLNEKKFRAETRSDENDPDSPKARPKTRGKKKDANAPIWESNFYNDEVLAIVSDYVNLGGSRILIAAPVPPARAAREPQMP